MTTKTHAMDTTGGGAGPTPIADDGGADQRLEFLSGIPNIGQFSGDWAIDEAAFMRQVTLIRTMDMEAHVARVQAAEESGRGPRLGAFERSGNTAVLRLDGPMTKKGLSLSGMPFGTAGLRASLRNAVRDDSVSSILLVVDSPGGTIAGTGDLARDILKARETKPVGAFIEDMGASAAYWVASQSDFVMTNAEGFVGSIGVYTVVEDWSELFAKAGVKVRVVRAGAFKGGHERGIEVTDEHLADTERVISEVNDRFVAAVATGRNIPEARVRAELNDGRIHVGEHARALNLIDGVGDFRAALGRLEGLATTATFGPTGRRIGASAIELKGDIMSDVTGIETPSAASIGDIEEACAGASSDFILAQVKGKATIAEAQSAFIAQQGKALAEAKAAVKTAEGKVAEAATATADAQAQAAKASERPGTTPLGENVGEGSEGFSDPVGEWDSAVAAAVATGLPKHKATAQVGRKNPELREAFLAAHNQSNGHGFAYSERVRRNGVA